MNTIESKESESAVRCCRVGREYVLQMFSSDNRIGELRVTREMLVSLFQGSPIGGRVGPRMHLASSRIHLSFNDRPLQDIGIADFMDLLQGTARPTQEAQALYF